MGITTFAFGMGGPVANFAALLHMTVHSLTKSAIFFTVGHAAQKAGSQLMEDIRGLITLSPTIGWGLMMGSLPILGIRPFDALTNKFLTHQREISKKTWGTPIPITPRGASLRRAQRVQPMVLAEQ
jgi:hydrogenase-4 component F